jgi:hypothetical protein
MDCYKRRELTPVQQSSSERWEPKARVTFYISGTASFLLEYSGILPTVLQEKGAHGWTDWKSFLGMRSDTYLNPV